MDIGEVAGEVLKLMNSKTEKKGPEFTKEILNVLSVCTCEFIRASYCTNDYDTALDIFIEEVTSRLIEHLES